jgi:membrane protein YdbS with pleckstrin-like domain
MTGSPSEDTATVHTKRWARIVSILVFAVVAVVSWWSVIQEGTRPAQTIAAVGASVAVVVQLVIVCMRRRQTEGRSAPGPN